MQENLYASLDLQIPSNLCASTTKQTREAVFEATVGEMSTFILLLAVNKKAIDTKILFWPEKQA